MARKGEPVSRIGLGKLKRAKPLLSLVATAVIIVLVFYNANYSETSQNVIISADRERETWVSMSLCWSHNAEVYKKGKFPYQEAARLSTRLWKNKTEANVVVKIIYEESELPDALSEYIAAMRSEGVEVLTESSGILDCVLQAQLARMYAYQVSFIQEEDLVLVIDVDAFILGSQVLDPLKEDYRVWIYRYAMTEDKGWTFNMNFIAMRARDWRYVLDLTDLGVEEASPAAAVKFFNDSLRFKSDIERWGIDQVILSHGILRRRLCSLPLNNPLWKELRLEAMILDDSLLCYHGNRDDCNKDKRTVPGGCTWWHFHPNENKENLNNKFREIIAN